MDERPRDRGLAARPQRREPVVHDRCRDRPERHDGLDIGAVRLAAVAIGHDREPPLRWPRLQRIFHDGARGVELDAAVGLPRGHAAGGIDDQRGRRGGRFHLSESRARREADEHGRRPPNRGPPEKRRHQHPGLHALIFSMYVASVSEVAFFRSNVRVIFMVSPSYATSKSAGPSFMARSMRKCAPL